ncbi:PAS domain S-box protein [Desulfocurvibacter africanus]|uniref:PAS domain S-box protein n=1 Tax=Desulfocurvibacter africanus TaxID=873 RepID=UPI0004062182|nr:PAS domain S-box protein [Desulfocurvibacter africanus]
MGVFLLALSIAVQLVAALLAIRQGRRSKAGLGWWLLAAAMLIMAVNRTIDLVIYRQSPFHPSLEVSANIAMLAVSVLLLVGIAHIGPLLDRLREAAERRSEEEHRLRGVVEAMPVMIHAHDASGGIVYWNRECERVTGYSAREMLGTSGKEDMLCRGKGCLPGDGKCVNFPWVELQEVEQTFRAKDGTMRNVLLTRVSGKASVPGWAWWMTGIDITDRRKTERRLAEREENYRKLFDSALDAIVIMDTQNSTVVDANPAALALFGYTREEMLGLPSLALTASPKRAQESFDELMAKGTLPLTRARQRRKDGSTFHSEISAASFESFGRKLVCVFFRDVSSEVATKLRLENAVRQARRSNRVKSEFLANMSHEIRTPIAGVIGTAKMALASERRGNQAEQLRRIENAARSLLSIVNDILDMSKIEAKGLEFRAKDFSPEWVVCACVEEFTALAQAKGLDLAAYVEPDVPACMRGDPDRLLQVLRNLVGNSLKFTERGHITISVRQPEKGETGLLYFSVKDTGIGIPKNRQKDLFKPFSQLDTTYAKRHQGTGLGLSISRRLVERMGGDIWVESERGQGSEFCFTARFEAAGGEFCPWQPEPPEVVEVPPLRILLAEDEQLNREFVTFFLSGEGHTVTTATNGCEALDLLERQDFDVVLMDVQMPELDGLEATRRIRSLEKPDKAHVPIIALTAYAMKEDRERVMAAGMDDYLSKPLDMDELRRSLARILAERKKLET